MFTQAGLNLRHRVICYGWTASRKARTGIQAAKLIRFEPSGDYAWAGRTFEVERDKHLCPRHKAAYVLWLQRLGIAY